MLTTALRILVFGPIALAAFAVLGFVGLYIHDALKIGGALRAKGYRWVGFPQAFILATKPEAIELRRCLDLVPPRDELAMLPDYRDGSIPALLHCASARLQALRAETVAEGPAEEA